MSDPVEDHPEPVSSPPRAPRWVKVAGVIAGVIVILVLVALIAGGEHSPRRHFGGEPSAPAHTPPPGVTHGEQR